MPIEQTTVSPTGSINKADWKSIGKGILITGAGAILTYLGPIFLGFHYDFTIYGHIIDLTAPVVVGLSALINVARKWITSHETPVS